MLWSRKDATRLRRVIPLDFFEHRAAVVAVIAHHDQEHPDAPAKGPDRILSIVQHTMNLARDVKENPDPYKSAAAGINARRLGQIDPQLLRLAARVLADLPSLVIDTVPTHELWGAE
jgi:hypothetical protein